MKRLRELENLEQLEEGLAEPYPEDVECAARLRGDVLVLGAGGKLGPSLVHRMVRSIRLSGQPWNVVAVSRFSDPSVKQRLERWGASALELDLFQPEAFRSLPDCPEVIHLVGSKFGTSAQGGLTWTTNVYLAGRVAERFRNSRIVALSTGNVYPLVRVGSPGSKETDPAGPVGEYAQSCLGRERVLTHLSSLHGTPLCLIRLNYAVEARYGVLLDIAERVYREEPVPLEMGYVNVIWQGDANSACFRALELCDSPPRVLNVTGGEQLSVRDLAHRFAALLGRKASFSGRESETALLSDAGLCRKLLDLPRVPVPEVMELVAAWIRKGGVKLGKPTHFEVRNGEF